MLTRGWPNGPPEAWLARLCEAIDHDLTRAECGLTERQRGLIRDALWRVLCSRPYPPMDVVRVDRAVANATTEWAFISELFVWGLIHDIDDAPDVA